MDLLHCTFEQDPRASGWTFSDPNGDNSIPVWSGAGGEAPCIAADGGCWESPPFPTQPYEYSRITFRSKSDGGAMWGAIFHDVNGRTLDSDHYSGMDASAEWIDNEFCFRGKAGAVDARICFRTPKGRAYRIRDVRVAPATRAEVGRWADALAATLPPLRYTPDPQRGAFLPKTRRALASGGVLGVVMLGDSIINDMGNSPWEVLVERRSSGARLNVMTSVRGSTGCPWYSREGRVRPYVLDYKPDLLLIGGLSNGGDAESVRSVIRQVRAAADPDALILFNGRLRLDKPTDDNPASFDLDPQGAAFRERFRQLAADERVEFFDVHTPWTDHLRNSPRPFTWYLRDTLHINARGRQVYARILERYFAF